MAKPKITRLGDPANPYTPGRVTRTGPQNRPTPAAIREAERRGPPMTRATAPQAKPKTTMIQRANDQYGGGARKRALDRAIDGATGSGKKK